MAQELKDHNYYGIDATIIADSINGYGNRITTFVVTFPRIVLAEFNTHRALSRNSASSRAIPFDKMVKMAKEYPFIPIRWMKAHKGMQGEEYFEENQMQYVLQSEWLLARDNAIKHASILNSAGLTKQVVNRLLEPFMWHTVIVTATEWQNFFSLRADEHAEIHIQDLAYKMLNEYNSSTPRVLGRGDWHIPFGDRFNWDIIDEITEKGGSPIMTAIKIAVARIARVSYLTFDGKIDYVADISLHDRLSTSGHWSPFEHVAKSDPGAFVGDTGNFKGFIQYRKMFSNENRIDKRVRIK